jgi:putative endonuclease
MTSKTQNKITGQKAESLAWEYLKNKKYKILACNYETNLGELDLIVKDGQEIVFVEVKARRSESWGDPYEAVNVHKQKKVIQVALQFIQSQNYEDRDFRFDVVSIVFGLEDQYSIEHYKDAFDASVASYML